MAFLSDSELCEKIRAGFAFLSVRRIAALTAVMALVGLEPSDPRYWAAVYPNDPASQRKALAMHQSGCGLVTEVGWEAAGLRDQRLNLPVGTRSVKGGRLYPVALERDIAMKWGGWREPDPKNPQNLPLEGDAVIIGSSSAKGIWGKGGFAMEHEFTCGLIERNFLEGGAAATIHSVDGGQPGVHCRTRVLIWCGPNGDELWAASCDDQGGYEIDPHDQRPTKGRRILGWIDTDALDNA